MKLTELPSRGREDGRQGWAKGTAALVLDAAKFFVQRTSTTRPMRNPSGCTYISLRRKCLPSAKAADDEGKIFDLRSKVKNKTVQAAQKLLEGLSDQLPDA